MLLLWLGLEKSNSNFNVKLQELFHKVLFDTNNINNNLLKFAPGHPLEVVHDLEVPTQKQGLLYSYKIELSSLISVRQVNYNLPNWNKLTFKLLISFLD